jgi:hypothetical protein
MSEKGEIKRDGSKATKNSGRGQYQKGDSILDIFTIDYKEYPKGFTINENAWAKICTDAMRNNRSTPMLKVVLGSGNHRTRLAVVSFDIIEDYIRLRQNEEAEALRAAEVDTGGN